MVKEDIPTKVYEVLGINNNSERTKSELKSKFQNANDNGKQEIIKAIEAALKK